MYIRPLAIAGELRKVPKVHILPKDPVPLRYHGHRIAITPGEELLFLKASE
jgi:hypothetical protein